VADIAGAILQGIFEIFFHFLGRMLLPIISGGRWRASPWDAVEMKVSVERQPGGTLLFSSTTTSLIGMAGFFIAAGLVITAIVYVR
jgi:hypothetical protein